MKFRKITIENFMRYQGKCEIEFSCDPEKNVTVVMGDNTYGKTTLAQAFRWGLYGEIIDTRYGKAKDIILLNKDIIAEMRAGTENVSVMIEVQEEETIFQFRREVTYEFGIQSQGVSTKKVAEKLYMRRKTGSDSWGEWKENDKDKRNPDFVNQNIKIMFPKELSNYFFFDGERWSDEKKTNSEIKNSINTLMGITPLVRMKEHLYNGNAKSVVKDLENSITGGSTKYDDIKRRIEDREKKITEWKAEIAQATQNAAEFRRKIEAAQEKLDSNQKIEQYQSEYKRLQESMVRQEKRVESDSVEIIKKFSSDAYKYLGATLLEEVVEMLQSVDLEGKDIPDVTSDTLDYLIQHKQCLCGNCIAQKELDYIEELRKVIPPNVIGSYVGQYQRKIEDWKLATENYVEDIREKAEQLEGDKAQLEEDQENSYSLEKLIDGKMNFELERKKMKSNQNNERMEKEKIQRYGYYIEEAETQIQSDKTQLERETAHTEANKRVQRAITYAWALYDETTRLLKAKEEPLMDELNAVIKKNFEMMFHEQEKYARMEEDYRLHLYYKKMGAGNDVEELNLSEGEIIARNFVFIVSILELARKKKEEAEDGGIFNLPLVLDGPFSKLGDVNTSLIAQVLPKTAEQVIVFMLDKDWDASGLDKLTLPDYRYRVVKDVDGNSSSLKRG